MVFLRAPRYFSSSINMKILILSFYLKLNFQKVWIMSYGNYRFHKNIDLKSTFDFGFHNRGYFFIK